MARYGHYATFKDFSMAAVKPKAVVLRKANRESADN